MMIEVCKILLAMFLAVLLAVLGIKYARIMHWTITVLLLIVFTAAFHEILNEFCRQMREKTSRDPK